MVVVEVEGYGAARRTMSLYAIRVRCVGRRPRKPKALLRVRPVRRYKGRKREVGGGGGMEGSAMEERTGATSNAAGYKRRPAAPRTGTGFGGV